MVHPYEESEAFRRACQARLKLQAEERKLKEQRNEFLDKQAKCFASMGLHVIPSEILRDNEIVVSRDVYERLKLFLS